MSAQFWFSRRDSTLNSTKASRCGGNDFLKRKEAPHSYKISGYCYSVFCLLIQSLWFKYTFFLCYFGEEKIKVIFSWSLSVSNVSWMWVFFLFFFELLHIFPTESERRERKLNYTIKIYTFWYFHMYTVEFFDTWLINAFWWSFNWTFSVCARRWWRRWNSLS